MQKSLLVLIFILAGLVLLQLSCGPKKTTTVDMKNNMLDGLSKQDLKDFFWLNEPENYKFENGSIKITANNKTDFFNNPEDNNITGTAPLFYNEVAGNFVITALVKPDFSSQWNAVSLMIYIDSTNWIKLAFENSDATGKSIVSVVTKGVSDDANGAILNKEDSVWLRIIRKGDIYAMHWSLNGIDYKMCRIVKMQTAKYIKAGIEAQCPIGEKANHEIAYFSLERKTINDLRKGI